LPNRRFSLSAYGSGFPVVDERGRPVASDMNRRVEILLKTARPVGGYQ
jgi:chemotaxis protein MotB